MSEPATNGTQYRLSRLESDVKELKEGQPAVIAERVGRLSRDVADLRDSLGKQIKDGDDALAKQIGGFRRIYVLTFSGLGFAIAGAVVAQILTGGT